MYMGIGQLCVYVNRAAICICKKSSYMYMGIGQLCVYVNRAAICISNRN